MIPAVCFVCQLHRDPTPELCTTACLEGETE